MIAALTVAPTGLSRLPANPDEGFPQSFLLALGERTYRIELYVDVAEHLLPRNIGPRDVVDVVGGTADSGHAAGILVATVAREQADGSEVILLRRRLLPGLLYTARELVLVVDEIVVAAGNLNGAGSHGSVLRARVGAR